MPIFKSRIKINSKSFIQNKSDMIKLVEKLHQIENRAATTSEKRKPRFQERGQLTPRERISVLLDPGMPFLEVYNMINYLVDDPKPDTSIPGATFITGIGFINGVRCFIMVDDSGINAGAFTEKSIDKAIGCIAISLKQKLPFVHLVESAGINLMSYTVELWAKAGSMFQGLAKLSASGIPTLAVLHGPSTAGGAYQPGLSDYVIGVKKNGMAALAGPALLHAATGEVSSNKELGGSEMHSQKTGLVEYLAENDIHSLGIARAVIKHTDWNSTKKAHHNNKFEEPMHSPEELAGVVPVNYKTPYDVREVVCRIVDGSNFIDFKSTYGISTVCIQAKIFGISIGIIGNNGPIDPDGATKAAQFIQLCDKSEIPIVFLNNTTGFMVGKDYEQAGMIKHGSKMIQAVTNSTTPKISFYIGASFGAGNYAMCGFGYEPDFLFSWPNSMTGVMGGEQAALTMKHVMEASATRKNKFIDISEMEEQVEKITKHFDEQSDSFCTSGRGLDHGIIDPRDTRKVIGFLVQTFLERESKDLKPNSFGIARF